MNSLELRLEQLRTEDPDEARMNAEENSLFFQQQEYCCYALEDSNNLYFQMEGNIGSLDSVYHLSFNYSADCHEGAFIIYKEAGEYLYYFYTGDSSNCEIVSEVINLSTGYFLLSFREDGELKLIVKGYVHGMDGAATFNGILITDEGEKPFAFKDDISYFD